MKPQHLRALTFIRNSIVHKGFAPSVQDLAKVMGFKSKHSAALIIDSLIEQGFLQRREEGSRQLQLLSFPPDMQNSVSTIDVPLVGTASCGLPLWAEENIEAMIPVSVNLARPANRYFFLRANGDSMNEAGIQDGELVLVRQQQTARAGDRVVALINDEATIKEYRPAKGVVMLMPRSSNKAHKPIILEADFQIQGVVIATLPDVSGPLTESESV